MELSSEVYGVKSVIFTSIVIYNISEILKPHRRLLEEQEESKEPEHC